MILPLDRLYKLHLQWLAVRSTFKGQSNRFFHRWLLITYPEFFEFAQGNAAQFRQQCLEIQRGSTFPRQRGIGYQTLKKYVGQLMTIYLTKQQKEHIAWEDFLNTVLRECNTEWQLKYYIQTHSV